MKDKKTTHQFDRNKDRKLKMHSMKLHEGKDDTFMSS